MPSVHRALGSGVEDERPREVDERIADRGHLPVDDREQLRRRVGREQHVVELVVAVAQRASADRAGGCASSQSRDVARGGQLAAAVRVELARASAASCRGEVVAGVGEVAEPARLPVDGVDRDERVDQLLEGAAAGSRARPPRPPGIGCRIGFPSIRSIT